jgi:hypothetical protein
LLAERTGDRRGKHGDAEEARNRDAKGDGSNKTTELSRNPGVGVDGVKTSKALGISRVCFWDHHLKRSLINNF